MGIRENVETQPTPTLGRSNKQSSENNKKKKEGIHHVRNPFFSLLQEKNPQCYQLLVIKGVFILWKEEPSCGILLGEESHMTQAKKNSEEEW